MPSSFPGISRRVFTAIVFIFISWFKRLVTFLERTYYICIDLKNISGRQTVDRV
jgi:hypothetical protein